MTPTNRYTRFLIPLVPLALVAAVGGCSSSPAAGGAPGTISPNVQLVDRTTHALSTGAMKWVNGTYTDCTNPFGVGAGLRTDAWSALITGTGPMTNAPLTVVKNDMACKLAITSIEADATYTGTPAVAINELTYNTDASSFSAADAGAAISFYANARASSLAFDADFSLTVLFSDNLGGASAGTSATYASVMAPSNTATLVPSPDYTVSFESFGITTDINQKVQTATGSVTVTPHSNPGESYVINTDPLLGSTFAAIDTAYRAGTPVAITIIPATTIAASAFSLDPGGSTVTLPTFRSVIIAHTVSGVTSYEVIRITFSAAG